MQGGLASNPFAALASCADLEDSPPRPAACSLDLVPPSRADNAAAAAAFSTEPAAGTGAGAPAAPPRALAKASPASARLLSEDVLLRVFLLGELGQRELGRCGRVCRDWRAVHRAPSLWQRLLRCLCRCFGSDPFAGLDLREADRGADDQWFRTHALIYSSLQRQCAAWSERGVTLGAKKIWDVVCCRSPLERYHLQQLCGKPRAADVAEAGLDESDEGWVTDRALHRGVWEVHNDGVRNQPHSLAGFARAVPLSGYTAADILVHVCLDWMFCQEPEVPNLGNLQTPYCGDSASSSNIRTSWVSYGRMQGSTVPLLATDITVAGDCLLGLHPTDPAFAFARDALARYDGSRYLPDSNPRIFQLETASPPLLSRFPAGCSWGPLCAVPPAFGFNSELASAPQSVNNWRCTAKGASAIVRAVRWRRSEQPGAPRAGARTIFLQSVRVTSPAWPALTAREIHPDQMDLLCGYLTAWFTGCRVAILDHTPLRLPAGPRQCRAISATHLPHAVNAHGYAANLPQMSADTVLSGLHSTVCDQKSGALLLPSAIAVLGVVGVDLFSPRRPLCGFLWAHGATASPGSGGGATGAGKRKRSTGTGSRSVDGGAPSQQTGVALGVLSLARGGGGNFNTVDGWGGSGGVLPLVKQGLRQVCAEAFGLSCCSVARCVLNPVVDDVELLALPPWPCPPCLDKLVLAGALVASGGQGPRVAQWNALERWMSEQDAETLGKRGDDELRWLKNELNADSI